MQKKKILSIKIDTFDYKTALKKILVMANERKSSYVCFTNVHMVMESQDDDKFTQVVNKADLALPDGMPLVWMLKAMGLKQQERICGPDMMLSVCEEAAKANIEVGFYGGKKEVLDKLIVKLEERYPNLNVVCSISPPFRVLTDDEDEKHIKEINDAGTKILFVGLGCPKQERWMYQKKNIISSVMLGVGAAFDFHSGEKKIAPSFFRNNGLEWLYRLLQDPKRLWKRYLKHNPRFLLRAFLQLVRERNQIDYNQNN